MSRGNVYFHRAGAGVIIAMVLAVISGLSFLGVSANAANNANLCQDKYFARLTSVLKERAALSDQLTQDQESLNRALLGHPPASAQSTSARASYQVQLDKVNLARKQHPIPPVPKC